MVVSSPFAAREEPIGLAFSSSSSSYSAPCSLKQFSRHIGHALFLILTGGAKTEKTGELQFNSLLSIWYPEAKRSSLMQGYSLRDVLQELRGIRHFKWYKLSLE